jgi:excisionase family DNA binding protein
MIRREARVPTEPLRASEAARRLDISTRELMQLIHDRKIRYVMVDGIAHVPEDALAEYQSKAS